MTDALLEVTDLAVSFPTDGDDLTAVRGLPGRPHFGVHPVRPEACGARHDVHHHEQDQGSAGDTCDHHAERGRRRVTEQHDPGGH